MVDGYSVAQRLTSLVQDKSLTDMKFLKEYCSEIRMCLSEFNINYNLKIFSSENYYHFPECEDTSFCDKKSIVKFNDLTIDIRSSLEYYNKIFIGLLNYAFVHRTDLKGIELIKSVIQNVIPNDTDFMITDSYTDKVLVKTKRVGDEYGSTISLINTSNGTEESKYKIYSSSKDILKVFIITPMDLMNIILRVYAKFSKSEEFYNSNNSFINKLQEMYDKHGIFYDLLEDGLLLKFVLCSLIFLWAFLDFVGGSTVLGLFELIVVIGMIVCLHFAESYFFNHSIHNESYFSDHCVNAGSYLLHNAFMDEYEEFMKSKDFSYEIF